MASVPRIDAAGARLQSVSKYSARPSDLGWIANRNLLVVPFIALGGRRRRLGEAAMVQMRAVLINMAAHRIENSTWGAGYNSIYYNAIFCC